MPGRGHGLTGVPDTGRAVRLLTAVAAMGLAFTGAIVEPVYLVPALTVVLVLGLAAEARPRLRPARVGWPARAAAPPAGRVARPTLAAACGRHDDEPR